MLKKQMMQEIIDLKLQGYIVAGIRDYYEAQGVKPPSMPTIRKYYSMDVLPDDPGEKLEKPKVFDEEPFRSEIIRVLENNRDNKNLCISSLYDFLEERLIENGFNTINWNERRCVSMRISRVRIDNYRNLKHVDVYLENVVALIGENNSGKSNFLRYCQ